MAAETDPHVCIRARMAGRLAGHFLLSAVADDYSFASFGITSLPNSCSERSASESDMVPRKR
jgi:hypothetical protein